MNEQLSTMTVDSSSPPKPAGRSRTGRRAWVAGVIAVVIAAAVIAWLTVGRDSSSSTKGPVASAVQPVALNAAGLATLAGTVGQPIYWAGQRNGYLYELRRTDNGNVYVRYLPPGVDAGAKGAKYLIVATYPFSHALAALEKVAGGRGIQVPGGGLALVDPKYPKSVHLAFPKVDYQVEVFDPSPKRALEVATSGQVRPAG
jgi:hypothetical protein